MPSFQVGSRRFESCLVHCLFNCFFTGYKPWGRLPSLGLGSGRFESFYPDFRKLRFGLKVIYVIPTFVGGVLGSYIGHHSHGLTIYNFIVSFFTTIFLVSLFKFRFKSELKWY